MQGFAFVLKDFLAGDVLGIQHATLGRAVHVLDQIAVQCAGEEGVLLFDKCPCGGVGQMLDGLAAQDRQFASARILRAELAIGFRQIITHQPEQQRFDFGVVQQLHFETVFEINQRVADVVGGFHQVHQRVTRPALVFDLRQAQFVGDLLEQRQLALIAAEFVFLVAQGVGVARGPRVLQVSAEGGVGQSGAAVELVILQLSQDPETLGIAFEIEEVSAFGFAHAVEPAASGGLLEPVADGVFTRMAERRIADIVGQTRRLHHHAEIGRVAPFGQGIAQGFTHPHAQRTADATDFQRVGQARVNMIVAGDRVDLGLAPETAEGAGEDNAVMVFVERAAAKFLRAVQRLAEAFAVEQGVPIQG
ncbi:hypothetical protein D3C87_1076520 [compost metagenome]